MCGIEPQLCTKQVSVITRTSRSEAQREVRVIGLSPAHEAVGDGLDQRERPGVLVVGFGRIVVSEIEAPILSVYLYKVVER
jgi:hypothetical protein